MSRKILIAGIALMAAVGCTKNSGEADSPQRVLSEYVSRSFAMKTAEDKAKLVELTTGEVKTQLEKLDGDSFKHFFVDTKKDFITLKVKDERRVGNDKVSITYELTYMSSIDKSGDSPESKDKVTNRKHAVFTQENGKWLISEVRNEKTYIEHQNELSF